MKEDAYCESEMKVRFDSVTASSGVDPTHVSALNEGHHSGQEGLNVDDRLGTLSATPFKQNCKLEHQRLNWLRQSR